MSQDTSSSTATASAGSGEGGQQGDALENGLHETRAFPASRECLNNGGSGVGLTRRAVPGGEDRS
jgi:hypothetical protein